MEKKKKISPPRGYSHRNKQPLPRTRPSPQALPGESSGVKPICPGSPRAAAERRGVQTCQQCLPRAVQWNSSTRLAGVTKSSASAQHLPEIINTGISHGERLAPLRCRAGCGGTSCCMRQSALQGFILSRDRGTG